MQVTEIWELVSGRVETVTVTAAETVKLWQKIHPMIHPPAPPAGTDPLAKCVTRLTWSGQRVPYNCSDASSLLGKLCVSLNHGRA